MILLLPFRHYTPLRCVIDDMPPRANNDIEYYYFRACYADFAAYAGHAAAITPLLRDAMMITLIRYASIRAAEAMLRYMLMLPMMLR